MSTSAAAVSTPAAAERGARPALLVGALGVVFGDIGTSPIYAFRESLRAAGGAAAQATVLGILSLVFWAVVLVVALKYVLFVMRADNQGEGGTMALISLALPAAGRLRSVLLTIGLGGASLFFGDAMITPAISVLSAIEGVQIATPALKPHVVPVAAGVLIALFAMQAGAAAGWVGCSGRSWRRGLWCWGLLGSYISPLNPKFWSRSIRATPSPMSLTPMAGSRSRCSARYFWR